MAVGAVVTPTPPVTTSPNDVLASPEARLKSQKRRDPSDLRSASGNLLSSKPSSERNEKPITPRFTLDQRENKDVKPTDDSQNKENLTAANNSSRSGKRPATSPSTSQPQPKSSKSQTTTPNSCICEGCSETHDGSYGSGRFCSVHCARRIAASRKWEKQRSERKHLAAVAAAAAAAAATVVPPQLGPMDQSTSSLSSTSSLDANMAHPVHVPHGNAMKRRRVLMMPPTHHPPIHALHPSSTSPSPPHSLHMASHLHPASHPAHVPSSHPHGPAHHSLAPELVHPQPQQYVRHTALPQPQPVVAHMAVGPSPLSATPSPRPYVEYAHMPLRAISPFHYTQPSTYYQYLPPVAFSRPSPQPLMHSQYPCYGKPHQGLTHPPPPPPPTPAPDSCQQPGQGGGPSLIPGSNQSAPSTPGYAPQAQVSSEKDCKAVAEALLTLKTGSNTD